ncbi:ABC transporter ATP-binding protein [Paenibacillus guangzhouensis]|uniref:ABC transporter ATP-binding protein n=1 Tax=Paenibacillus guangzhouensis TaxID=1473112 RepID=UPI002AAF827D|nr:ABC transporter ATP-binding protein [Paenibacillus guangzhouensis]
MMTLLQVDRLSKRFKQHHAVKEISFSIEEGRCVALLGPNGAGKTTTIHMLTGLLRPTSGEIRLIQQGKQVADRRPYLGYLPQMPVFYSWMTGHEFVQYAGQLAGLTKQEASRRTKEWLDIVGLQDAGKRRIGGYSGGMKQRLGLAQALIHRPKLLILDEPVSALDPIGRRDVIGILEQIRQETTVLFSTHILHDAEEICDDILLIEQGEIAVQGSLDQIRQAHSEPLLVIETLSEGDAKKLEMAIRNKSYVRHIVNNRQTLRVTVTALEEAERGMMAEAVQHQIFIRKLEAGYSTLEDLFMKVVQA